jgi:iron(III) transport system permease protein
MVRASQADEMPSLLTAGNAGLLANTMLLAGGVLLITTFLALPLAWLTVRTTLAARRFWSVLAVMPLAIPGYVTAYALLSLGGAYDSVLGNLFNWQIARPRGYLGALLALSAYNLPYMFLTLRAAMQDLDPSIEEAARSLGRGRIGVICSIVLPQLAPAFLAGAMLVILHVVADFGVVSLMQYDTFSLKLWNAFTSEGTTGAAPYALTLTLVSCVFIVIEMAFLRKLRLDRAGVGVARKQAMFRLGWLQLPVCLAMAALFVLSVVVPAGTVIYWMGRIEGLKVIGDFAWTIWNAIVPAAWEHAVESSQGAVLAGALWSSFVVSFPAAVCTTLLAVPIALMRARYPSRTSFLLERLPFVGYAVPALAFGLSLVVLCNAKWVPDWFYRLFYQSLPLVVVAYAFHFLAEAVGPVRSSMYMASPKLEEASRSLGRGRVATFFRVTLPVLRHGLIVSMALVFLSCMKELPLTAILSPPGFETLAWSAWDRTNNVQFAEAAPFALAILIFSAAFVGVLLLEGREK